MSECPYGERFKPLPLRRGFWRDLPSKLKEGVVLLARDLPEREDVRNAAQSILIDHIESRLMKNFRRPALSQIGEFYAEFFAAYVQAIRTEEFRIWKEIGLEVDLALAERPDRNLTALEAAELTYALLGYPEPPNSTELYENLAAYARAYEELLQEKYGEEYAPRLFYKALRTHMIGFLLRLIAMDSVISVLLTMNVTPKVSADGGQILKPDTIIDSRFLEVCEDDSFVFLPKFVDEVHEHARQQNFREDSVGRTEDRGCPVLYSPERDAILRFAIEELIAQHEIHENKT